MPAMKLLLAILASTITIASALDWHEEGDLFWAEHCDWQGNDLRDVAGPPEQCGPMCGSTQGCTHFTWTNFNGGTCWMKGNGAQREQAQGHDQEYSVCGYMKQSGGGGPSSSGQTTRYWDCCKVSCGWNGKAAFNAPVQSCQQNGVDAADINAQSGCNGGPAFTCSNNQPWAINDNLAYGFAAAKLSGQSEGDWCCGCYELTFTSGHVNGKKIIVQVSNTGGDLGANHFDLQIPGGGVGIFNGCKPQWGAPDEGWGARYGGVGDRGACDQLPEQLRQGCYWRFDWFKNADNPTVDFRKVKCPAELTEKSGCRRNDD